MQYCLYLRKSRADAEAEARGEGETLARHEKTLLELARKLNLTITEIYREIVSGDTIAARPVMQQLLSEVEQGVWDGVLVMEVERLARGDTVDQGIVAQTFKYSGTLIITPSKTYNPNNEFDEEYFEFGLFMSRREYKTINRRLQRGRLASVKEGKYLGSKAPYGYNRVRIKGDKGWTLEPNEAEAEIVRLIFSLYVDGVEENGESQRIGTGLIAKRLNTMGVKPQHSEIWTVPTVRDILINPVYIGKIRWNGRPTVKKRVNGEVKLSRPRSAPSDVVLVDGLHPAIITEEIFNKAQEFMKSNPPRPIGERGVVKNPLSGLLVCGICGRKMVRRPYGPRRAQDTIMCPLSGCANVSCGLEIVEKRLLEALASWLEGYKLNWNAADASVPVLASDIHRSAVQKAEERLDTLNKQLAKAHDFLEQGVYDVDTFLLRSRELGSQISEVKETIKQEKEALATAQAHEASTTDIVPRVEAAIDLYPSLVSPRAKNDLLKSVLEKVVYTKLSGARWHGSVDDFTLELFPKIPAQNDKN